MSVQMDSTVNRRANKESVVELRIGDSRASDKRDAIFVSR